MKLRSSHLIIFTTPQSCTRPTLAICSSEAILCFALKEKFLCPCRVYSVRSWTFWQIYLIFCIFLQMSNIIFTCSVYTWMCTYLHMFLHELYFRGSQHRTLPAFPTLITLFLVFLHFLWYLSCLNNSLWALPGTEWLPLLFEFELFFYILNSRFFSRLSLSVLIQIPFSVLPRINDSTP